MTIRKQLDEVINKAFVFGDDNLPDEIMEAFLEQLGLFLSHYENSGDAEVREVVRKLRMMFNLEGPAGANRSYRERRRIF